MQVSFIQASIEVAAQHGFDMAKKRF